jgi:hypothetical protein
MHEIHSDDITPLLVSLNKALCYKHERPRIKSGDELGVSLIGIDQTILQLKNRLNCSPWNAQDQRDVSNRIGFVPLTRRSFKLLLEDYVWQYGFTAPRREIIDQTPELTKHALVVFLVCNDKVITCTS